MHAAVRPETHDSARDGGPREPLLTRLLHDPFVERVAVLSIVLTEEDPEERAFFR